MTTAFDTSLPSPIVQILQLRDLAEGSVVPIGHMTDIQKRTYIESPVEDRIAALAEGPDRAHMIVITGSAGGGKSALIERLRSKHRDAFGDIEADATHTHEPSEEQADLLEIFFDDFADGNDPSGLPTRLIALNVGLLIHVFDEFDRRGVAERFSTLRSVLFHRLGLQDNPAPDSLPWKVAVINLDSRPTTGDGGIFADMLHKLDPDDPQGLLVGAPRCGTCTVREWCPVRSNLMVMSRTAPTALDSLALRAAMEHGRYDSPRELWDLAARLATGDDAFDSYEDPCDAVTEAAASGDGGFVLSHILPANLFTINGSDIGRRLQRQDPASRPSADAHQYLSMAGPTPGLVAASLRDLDPGDAEALATASARAQELLEQPDHSPDTARSMARLAVAARFLKQPEEWSIADPAFDAFAPLLKQYASYSRGQAIGGEDLEQFHRTLEAALASIFGVHAREVAYIPIQAYDPREPSRIYAEASLVLGDTYDVAAHPPIARNPESDEVMAIQPLEITVNIAKVPVPINLAMFRLLHQAGHGTVASTADLERFYTLRRAVESLAARSAGDERARLLVEDPRTNRRYSAHLTSRLGQQHAIEIREIPT